MKKTVSHLTSAQLSRPANLSLIVASSLILTVGMLIPTWRQIASADQYQNQINALQSENAASQATVSGLRSQAASYNDAIAQLQAQINGLQASINANVALQLDLQNQIVAAQNEIDHQRAILASDLKSMYVDGTPSSLELLATSKNLSDFVDKQEYRSRVQNKLQDTLKKIADLQKQLQVQKAKVESLLMDMRSQQSQLDADRAQQQSLLNYNQQQQSSYNAQIKANNNKVAQLRAAQAIANRALSGSGVVAGDAGHGGYPNIYNNATQDSLVDRWGLYNRECVSYTAWKVYQTYGYMPYWGGQGNANEWPGNAARAGIPTSHTPRAQTVAIWNVGYYGHSMWVEAVNGDGSLWVSQYNYDYNGHYSEMRVSASMAANLTYIYFN
jgi:surface antigen